MQSAGEIQKERDRADSAEDELEALSAQVCSLESKLEEAHEDLRNWEARACEAEHDFEMAHAQANEYEREAEELRDDLERKITDYDDLEIKYGEERCRRETAEHQRDCYKAVLDGMEFNNTETYPENGLEFCEALGESTKELIQKMTKIQEKE